MHRFGLICSALCVALLAGCGTKYEDCGDGLARADDGNCYPYRFTDSGDPGSGLPGGTGDDLDDPPLDEDNGTDADGIDVDDSGPPDNDGAAPDDGGAPADVDGGAPADVDGGAPADVDGGPSGDVDGGPSGDVDGGPSGDVDGGPSDDGGSAGDGGGGMGPGSSCTSDDDCELSDCPDGSTGCGCLDEINECIPTCSSDEDCPEDTVGGGFSCDEGFCKPGGGGVDVEPPDDFEPDL